MFALTNISNWTRSPREAAFLNDPRFSTRVTHFLPSSLIVSIDRDILAFELTYITGDLAVSSVECCDCATQLISCQHGVLFCTKVWHAEDIFIRLPSEALTSCTRHAIQRSLSAFIDPHAMPKSASSSPELFLADADSHKRCRVSTLLKLRTNCTIPFMILLGALTILLSQIGPLFATPATAPTVTLDSAVFTGITEGQVTKYLGIPYAQPP